MDAEVCWWRLLYGLSKTRGHKHMLRYFPVDVPLLLPILARTESPTVGCWEER